MIYLRPRSTRVFNQPRPHQPLVMMWGDIHRSASHMCQSCECEAKSKECCYTIYDPTFLKQLDALAKDYPIDFYTEYARTFDEVESENEVLFRRFLQNTTAPCHGRNQTPNNKARCPTQHIRWHYADPRWMKDSIEHHLLHEYIQSPIFHELSNTLDEWRQSGDPRLTHFLEAHKVHHLQKLVLTQEAPEFEPFRLSFLAPLLQPPPADQAHNPVFYVERYRKMFTLFVTEALQPATRKSPIVKQLARLQLPTPLTPEDMVDFLTSSFITVATPPVLFAYEKHIQTLAQDQPAVLSYLYHVLTTPAADFGDPHVTVAHARALASTPVESIWLAFVPTMTILFHLFSYFADVYALLRMIKPPQGGSPPYLALGYFGAAHLERMIRILQLRPYFDYEIVAYVPKNPPHRCITLPTIDLVTDLERHAQRILDSHPDSANTLQNWRTRNANRPTKRMKGIKSAQTSFRRPASYRPRSTRKNKNK